MAQILHPGSQPTEPRSPEVLRSPSPIDRREGLEVFSSLERTQVVRDSPRTYTHSSYDVDTGTSITRVTIEQPGGIVVTTSIKIQRKDTTPPGVEVEADSTMGNTSDGNASDSEGSPEDDDGVIVTMEPPVFNLGLPGEAMVPIPPALRRPNYISPSTPIYVVFAGLRVGIFLGDWHESIGRFVHRVPGQDHKRYATWDEAIWWYANAYQGLSRRHSVRIVGTTEVPNPAAASYQPGSGPKVGDVDITGLDLNVSNLPLNIADFPKNTIRAPFIAQIPFLAQMSHGQRETHRNRNITSLPGISAAEIEPVLSAMEDPVWCFRALMHIPGVDLDNAVRIIAKYPTFYAIRRGLKDLREEVATGRVVLNRQVFSLVEPPARQGTSETWVVNVFTFFCGNDPDDELAYPEN
ncbi:hypothetical protein V5O48_018347 [Marasmius crinis-equi]|uniref:Uncharacterized protein n=1 Tax=Marasmius crinis-equi TaxID=585013 RepID=A0ABR3ELI2_9AGAR